MRWTWCPSSFALKQKLWLGQSTLACSAGLHVMLFSLHRGGERISVLLISRHATHAKGSAQRWVHTRHASGEVDRRSSWRGRGEEGQGVSVMKTNWEEYSCYLWEAYTVITAQRLMLKSLRGPQYFIVYFCLSTAYDHVDLTRLHDNLMAIFRKGGTDRETEVGRTEEGCGNMTRRRKTRKLVTYSCSRETSPLNACLSIDWISFLYK